MSEFKQFEARHHIETKWCFASHCKKTDVSLVRLVKESVYGRHQNSGSFSSSHGFPCFLKWSTMCQTLGIFFWAWAMCITLSTFWRLYHVDEKASKLNSVSCAKLWVYLSEPGQCASHCPYHVDETSNLNSVRLEHVAQLEKKGGVR